MAAVDKAKFKRVAESLIGVSGKFAALRADCVFKKSGEFNYSAQSAPVATTTVQMVDIGVMQSPKQGKSIAQNEIKLIGLYDEFPELPAVDDSRFTFNGKAYAISSIEIDPAQATVTIKGII